MNQPDKNNKEPISYKVPGLFIRRNSAMKMIPFGEIIFMKAEGNYTSIHMLNPKEVYLSTCTLGKIDERLNNSSFCRVHRSYIINLEHVTGLIFNCIKMGDHRIPVGRNYKEVLDYFICV